MTNDVLFIGWNRPVAGRENNALELFSMVTNYLGTMQKKDAIASFEPVLLTVHGGDLNGFVLVRGEQKKLANLRQAEEFQNLVTSCAVALEGFGVIEGWSGEKLQHRMKSYHSAVAKL